MPLPNFQNSCRYWLLLVVFLLLFCCLKKKRQEMGKALQIKDPVRLRQRETKDGRRSLYLDTYLRGSRRLEFLRLYLLPGNSAEVRAKNKETLALAEAVRAKRLVELRNGDFGFTTTDSGVLLFDYLDKLSTEKQRGGIATSRNWRSMLMHLQRYERRRDLLLSDLDRAWVQGFVDYLLTAPAAKGGGRIASNTAAAYLAKLRCALRRATAEGLIQKNPAAGVEGIKKTETTRQYLTIDELRRLIAAPCRHEGVRRAFLFSCLTGLRRSDVLALTWGEVYTTEGGTRLVFKQRKTGGLEYLDINSEAAGLMGDRGADKDHVFTGLPTATRINYHIDVWRQSAGLRKHITFHCARHTFATLMLSLGVDIYTTSRLLGHRDLATTQIYAKIIDEKKRAAVDAIPKLF